MTKTYDDKIKIVKNEFETAKKELKALQKK